MKTRRRTRKTPKRQCSCNCDATIKSPEIPNNKKKSRGSLKVNEKSIKIQKPTKKTNKTGVDANTVKKQFKNDTLVTMPQISKTNLTKITIKQPLVILKRLDIKSPTMKLRGNRQKNYCEPPSLDESTREKSVEPVKKPTEKVPIYKQPIEENTEKSKKKKKKDDLYEFDSDSEETKRKRRRQRKLNDSSYDEYNKTIENILRNVALKIKERKHSPGKKTDDINTNNNTNFSNNNNKNKNGEKIKRTRVKRRKLQEEQALKETQIVGNNNEKIDNQKSSTPPKPLPQISKQDDKSSEFNQDSLASPSKLATNDVDKTFGFLDDNEEIAEIPMEGQANRTPKINVISNIKLKPHQQLIFTETPTQSPIVQPNANSTMIYNVLTPWRFNEINIRRNPHLIQVKNSALPCITQEPVLEYSIIEKLASTPRHNGDDQSFIDEKDKNSVVQTPSLRRSPRKYATSTIQKTLDDYYGNNSENKENQRVITRYSLFDADELSPVKSVEDKRSPLAPINSIKRQILNDFNENTKENTQITINLNKINDKEVKTYFGFETSKESDDNSKIDNDKVNKDDRPYRLSINTNDKKYEVKKKRVRIEGNKEDEDEEGVVEDPPNKVISDNDLDGDSKSDAESVGGGLFEEMYDDQEKKENKTMKKRKIKWMLTDDTEDYKPRKRRKDVRTKKEEEEAERWAEQFNSMCKEVEEFPLEIE